MGKKKVVQKQAPAQPQVVVKSTEKAGKKSKRSAQKQQPAPQQHKAAGKTKAIKKQQKPVKPVKEEKQHKPVEKVEKKSKPAQKQEESLQVFTPEFYDRVNTFQSFYKEVLELKSSSNGGNIADELTSVNNRVREALQTASGKILKEQLVGLEEWIQGEQKRLEEEISAVEKCLEATQKSVEGIKEFTVDEIQSQLKPIKDRIAQKESTLASYGTLLTRSQGIYQEAPIEEEKKEVHKPEENNKDDEEQDLDLDLP